MGQKRLQKIFSYLIGTFFRGSSIWHLSWLQKNREIQAREIKYSYRKFKSQKKC